MKKIAFIGGGNLASAIVTGMITSKNYKSENIIISNPSQDKLQNLKTELKVKITSNNLEAVTFADVVILSVKPNIYQSVIDEIKSKIDNKLVITVAAGTSLDFVEKAFNKPVRVIRTMPNTPCKIRSGMTSIVPNKLATKDDINFTKNLFDAIGKSEIIEEDLIDTASAIAGSSPALVYMFIEALADGAVLNGMKRKQAYKFASQAVLGSAKMVLETGMHPAELKDNVASPSGTTIEAIKHLEENAFRGIIINSIKKCVKKAKKMAKF